MKRLTIALVLTGILSAQATSDFAWRVDKFNEKWTQFLGAYYGCPEGEPMVDYDPREDCSPMLSRYDMHAFNAAKKWAKQVFDLHE